VVPCPERSKRVLWDQHHSISFPQAFVPADELISDSQVNFNVLDWPADHLYTNFNSLFDYLRQEGYYLEVIQENLLSFDAKKIWHFNFDG